MLKYILLCYMICLCGALKTMVLKPGGLKGFYMIGISKYIRDHYDLSNWQYYGASAGAWNALYLSCKKEELFMQQIQELGQFSYNDLYDLETTMKKRILKNFEMSDFQLNRLHICVSTKPTWLPLLRKHIIKDFEDLDDMVESCIASSHLPLISNGNFFYEYRNKKCIDGGAFRLPYRKRDKITPDFILCPDSWKNTQINDMNRIYNMDVHQLLYNGYNDAYKNREKLDACFNNPNRHRKSNLVIAPRIHNPRENQNDDW